MRNYKWLVVMLMLLLTGCVHEENESSSTETTSALTITPYNMKEQESMLISKTDVGNIEFFKLNGTLTEKEDLQISVDVFEHGVYKEELLKTFNYPEKDYKNQFISFAVSGFDTENRQIKLTSGLPSGLATTTYTNKMTGFSFGRLIETAIHLKKNEPVYLAAWQGTTKNALRAVGIEKGNLPAGIENTELAFLYKIIWTDKEEL